MLIYAKPYLDLNVEVGSPIYDHLTGEYIGKLQKIQDTRWLCLYDDSFYEKSGLFFENDFKNGEYQCIHYRSFHPDFILRYLVSNGRIKC